MVGSIVAGICVGVLVVMVNEVYRRNLKKEILEVKKVIYEVARDFKQDGVSLTKEIINVYEKDKELMEILKREVIRSNEEE
jgi:hypothetical protein